MTKSTETEPTAADEATPEQTSKTGDEGSSPRASAHFKAQSTSTAKLGTFLGVFTPTLLTILGVIMYLRFGWVVGQVGLVGALVIVVLANVVTVITAVSFSSIATNTRVGVGGAYYIISRSLGLEIGGAIGIPLYLSQVFSVTLYAFGLAEIIGSYWTSMPVNVAAFVIIIAVGGISLMGAKRAMALQTPILAFVGISLVALVVAGLFGEQVSAEDLGGLKTVPDVGFWAVFAVFFPAVTGVMAGLGLSGDLKDARVSIPRGSISATLTGFAVYVVVVVVLAHAASTEVLRADDTVWIHIVGAGVLGFALIMPGLLGAIFSSAVGSMLGAPRTLQALALDRAKPTGWLARVSGRTDQEPIAGIVISLFIALGAVFLGNLNAVAEVVSMFFLTVYGAVNLVAALETLSGDSTWRPKIRSPWPISLLGALACFGVMLLINWWASLAAFVIELLLWLVFSRWERSADWGDMRRDIYEALIRWALIKLRHRPMTARNWRPHVLVFADRVEERLGLVRFANWLSQDRGVVTVCELRAGDLLEPQMAPAERQGEVDRALEGAGIVAFGEVTVVREIDRGIVDVVQANGLAGLHSNTAMFGWPKKPQRLAEILGILQRLETIHKSVIIGKVGRHMESRQGVRRRIHLWWGGLQRNGDMMLLLAHLLTRNVQWRGAEITILSIASNDITKKETQDLLDHLLPEARIEAVPRVLVKPKEESIRDIIHRESARADVVFLGLATPQAGEELAYAERLQELAGPLHTVFFVKNGSLFVGKLV